MYDAIGNVLSNLTVLDSIKNIIVIITDGHDNASKEYTSSSVRTMIESYTNQGVEFVFLGANQDIILAAQSLNINPRSVMRYNTRDPNTSFSGLNTSIGRARSNHINVEFTAEEIHRSEDLNARIDAGQVEQILNTPVRRLRNNSTTDINSIMSPFNVSR